MSLPFVPLVFDALRARESALEILFAWRPDWKASPNSIKIDAVAEGVTNNVFKVTRSCPAAPALSGGPTSPTALLLRAYQPLTLGFFDREAELVIHRHASELGLASTVLARFDNGLLCDWIPGQTCHPDDLSRESVWRATARRLGEWHARMPASPDVVPRDVWTILELEANELPDGTEPEKELKRTMQDEVAKITREGRRDHSQYVCAHGDLFHTNIIIEPPSKSQELGSTEDVSISLIDFEFACRAPAAWDIVTFFAEQIGLDRDYERVAGPPVRRAFIEEYVAAYGQHGTPRSVPAKSVDELCAEVDALRALPALFFGIHLTVMMKGERDVPAEGPQWVRQRFREYRECLDEMSGERARRGVSISVRESRWLGRE